MVPYYFSLNSLPVKQAFCLNVYKESNMITLTNHKAFDMLLLVTAGSQKPTYKEHLFQENWNFIPSPDPTCGKLLSLLLLLLLLLLSEIIILSFYGNLI
uniref:Uncharacterized protein LOC104217430 n=1 Tax=Nicotiana sylvestris TaxID=4096 RepID=A0A1U7VM01_NICSY|nr:PREDICTED: uncharacterized protein LOC104217430 [Nicotiana sylvestris]